MCSHVLCINAQHGLSVNTGFSFAPQNILTLLVDGQSSLKIGVLTPLPCYRTTAQTIEGLGAVTIPYHLSEEDGWELRVEELHRALESAQGVCKPVAVYITNPGNPAGKPRERSSPAPTCMCLSVFVLFFLGLRVVNLASGQIQSRKSIQEVIQFAYEKKLFLLADEVCKPHRQLI